MNRLTFIIVIFFPCLINSACKKDFLEAPQNEILLRQPYVKDLATTEEYLNGIYFSLVQVYSAFDLIYPELIADNIKPVAGTSTLSFFYNWEQQATEAQEFAGPSESSMNMNGTSTECARTIRDCNFILEKAAAYRLENSQKADDLMGQALAIRAMIHFTMVNIFSHSYAYTQDASHLGVPYILTSDWTLPVSRLTVRQVYDNIIADLRQSIQLLAPRNTPLYINLNAAKAFLSRVYLFKADYEQAKNLAKEVISVVPLMTTDYPEKLFTPDETEALFQLTPESEPSQAAFAGLFFSPNSAFEFIATSDLAILLQESPSDKRNAWVTDLGGDWQITKFPVGAVADISPAEGAYYQTLIRSSELYLTLAECYAKMGPTYEDSARTYLDAIRQRADDQASPSTVTGAAMLEAVYKERRKELAFEGLRMQDLQRWKKGVIRNDAPNPEAKELPYPSNKAIAPIPILDVKLSGIPQNSGY